MLAGLVQAIHDLADGNKGGDTPVVIGCSPWLTDDYLVDALTRVHTCIVTTKPYKRAAPEILRLHRDASPIPKLWLRSLDGSGLPGDDGYRPGEWMGDTYNVEGHDFYFGPVRVAGWRKPRSNASSFPLIHAKVAVLGYHEHSFFDTGYGEAEVFGFRATAAWTGSANFTRQSRVHAEVGMLTTNPSVIFSTERFLCDVLRISETFGDIIAVDPSPELVDAHAWEPSASDLEYMRHCDAEYMADTYGTDRDEH